MLYRLHKSILASRLELFGGMFVLSNGQRQPEDGQDDDHPVQIEDGIAVREDFESLIKHIYGQCVSHLIGHYDCWLSMYPRWDAPPYPVPFLLSVLRLSTRWGSEDGRKRAIYYLGDPTTKFPNLLKFHASITYNVPQWTRPAFDTLVSTDWRLGDLPLLSSYDLSLDIVDLVIKTRDVISCERRRLATVPPPVDHHQECPKHKCKKCGEAWTAAWILAIGRQVVHVEPLFQLQSYQAEDVIKALVVPGMSEQCLELTIAKTLEGDAFDYVHKVCTAALAQLSPL